MTARYVYVASSWRNDTQPMVVEAIRAAGIGAYDFKNPDGATGFHWSEVGLHRTNDAAAVLEYLWALDHPRAKEGFAADFAAMQRADAFVLVLPCGRSAHLELGWAVGAGKPTAILLEDPCVPELMYSMATHLTPSLEGVVRWLRELPDPPAKGTRVTATDVATGEQESVVLVDDFVLITDGTAHVTHCQAHASGTTQLTIKRGAR